MSNGQRWAVVVAIYAAFVLFFHASGEAEGYVFVAGWVVGAASLQWIGAKAEREEG